MMGSADFLVETDFPSSATPPLLPLLLPLRLSSDGGIVEITSDVKRVLNTDDPSQARAWLQLDSKAAQQHSPVGGIYSICLVK